jgi:hypothetical protein
MYIVAPPAASRHHEFLRALGVVGSDPLHDEDVDTTSDTTERNTQKERATASKEIGLSKPILQRTATSRTKCRRIVAPKGAGSIPVGQPLICR